MSSSFAEAVGSITMSSSPAQAFTHQTDAEYLAAVIVAGHVVMLLQFDQTAKIDFLQVEVLQCPPAIQTRCRPSVPQPSSRLADMRASPFRSADHRR